MARESSPQTSAGSTGRMDLLQSWMVQIPNSGTAWEVGYAFGGGKPILLIRTDFRMLAGTAGDYNPMLAQSATIRVDAPAGSTSEVTDAILDALSRIETKLGRSKPA